MSRSVDYAVGEIPDCLKNHNTMTISQLKDELGVGHTTVEKAIAILYSKGEVVSFTVKNRYGGSFEVYALAREYEYKNGRYNPIGVKKDESVS